MRNRLFSLSLLFILCISSFNLFAQGGGFSGGEARLMNSRVMIIPYTVEGEDIRKVIETKPELRIAMSKLKDEFDRRGVKTMDFITSLKAVQSTMAFTSDNQADFKTSMIMNSGADIYVTIDAQVIPVSGLGHRAKIMLQAVETQSSYELANKMAESRYMNISDNSKLFEEAINSISEEFLNTIRHNFDEILEHGRSINVVFGFDSNSEYDMDSEIGGESIANLLEQFIENHSFKNQYRLGGSSSIQMIFNEVKIPVLDIDGKNYNANKFASEIIKYLKSKGLDANRSLNGGLIQIRIK